jgi:hypothetical protein
MLVGLILGWPSERNRKNEGECLGPLRLDLTTPKLILIRSITEVAQDYCLTSVPILYPLMMVSRAAKSWRGGV